MRRIGFVVAAACALVLVAPAALLHVRADHISDVAEVRAVDLPDGSRVKLGPDSAITVDYGADRREVRLLAGQAWFDVKRDAGKPFMVRSGDVSTTVLGTSFDVRHLGGVTSVAVQRGRVRVAGGRHRTIDLGAGDWLRLSDAGIAQGQDPAAIGAWRTGEIIAANRTIAEIVDEIRPWYRGRIVLLDKGLASRRVTGVFRAGDPAYALSVITNPYGGKVRRITPWLIFVSGP